MKSYKRFFVGLACFLFLLLCFAKEDALAAPCSPLPSVKIVGSSYAPTSIQDAYDYASSPPPSGLGLSSFTLLLAGGIFYEDAITLDGGSVVLDGGYDCSFTTKDSTTGIFGTITISTGSLNYAAGTGGVGIVSTDQCAFDRDGDNYTSIGSCSGTADDCDDNNPDINPGAVEICDGLDNNCDGQIDEGLVGTDADGDSYIAIGSCGAVTDDCNDNVSSIYPGAAEIPYDGIDQDCNGTDLTFANNNSCDGCHDPDNLLDGAHSYRPVVTDSSCAICHAALAGSILSGHYGRTVRTTDNDVAAGSTINCWTCHDNDDHSGGGVFGDGLGDVWSDVSPPYPGNYTCDNCHANRAARHATATAHDNRIIDNFCGLCHTSDNSVLGSPGDGELSSDSDVDALHGVDQVVQDDADCAICHSYTDTAIDASLVRLVIQQGLDGIPQTCTNCHTDKGANHGDYDHPVEVGPNDLSYDAPGTLCSACHVVADWTEIETIEHNVPTNGVGSCATCHNSSRQIVQNIIADAPSYGGYPIRCLACHADKELTPHGSVDHVTLGYVIGGATACTDCHDPGPGGNATVDVTHMGQCSLCHVNGLELQPGLPAGGGDCIACHTLDWDVIHSANTPSHNSLVQVDATSCAGCHNDPPPLVNDADPTVHSDCYNCHDAEGALVETNGTNDQDFTTGGDCTTCHGNSFENVHTDCTACHGQPPSGTTPPNTEGAHSEHAILGFGSVTPICGACHDGAIHNGTTDVAISSSFDAKSGPASSNGNTCSSTSCHGGQTTPAWSGSINVNAQCNSCHEYGTSQYNSYNSGEHYFHIFIDGMACLDCHNVTKLATGHFSNLETPTFEQDPGATIGGNNPGGGTGTFVSNYNVTTNTCTTQCHAAPIVWP